MQSFLKKLLLITAVFCSTINNSKAQDRIPGKAIHSYPLSITYNKTTVLVFPASIEDVDRGSAALLAAKMKDAANVLKLKADKKGFIPTNLSVLTSDGKLYSFNVDYAANPACLAYDLNPSGQIKSSVELTSQPVNDSRMKALVNAVYAKRPFLHRSKKSDDMKMRLCDIYYCEGMLLLKFIITNSSAIDYHTGLMRFYIKDDKQVKRTASHEEDLTPLYITNGGKLVAGNSTDTLIVAFSQFTIPDHKRLVMQLFEKNGGRDLTFIIKGKTLLKARRLQLP
jgi:conjugative transposon TraN protein